MVWWYVFLGIAFIAVGVWLFRKGEKLIEPKLLIGASESKARSIKRMPHIVGTMCFLLSIFSFLKAWWWNG